jgi:hypothetical protein
MTSFERTYRRSGQWKAIAVAFAILVTAAATEWFVTYCAFSSNCPTAEKIGDWPLGKMKAILDAE